MADPAVAESRQADSSSGNTAGGGIPCAVRRVLDRWFDPKRFESERLYERLGARVLKRYVPTGGDLVMRWVRRRHPDRRWVAASVGLLLRFERRTRVHEAIHVLGSVVGAVLIVERARRGALTRRATAAARTANAVLGVWPVVLQRYNRLRAHRALEAIHRRGQTRERRRAPG